jgi:hypothetical protein
VTVNDLTDLEICKRIAEIECVEHYISDNKKYCMARDKSSTYVIRYVEYNPLTDDALCFKLMVKYKISLIQHQNNTAVYCIWDHDEKHATNTMTNPNRAICLAIIKSKE